MYNDFANLIGKANGAISGDVPFSLQVNSNINSQKENPINFSIILQSNIDS